jgi:hypothetical protein
LFTPASERPTRYVLPIRARCNRCGEIVTGEINLANDLSLEEGESANTYTCRKVLVGSGANRCFQQIEVNLRFDQSRKIIEQQVTGGVLLDDKGEPFKV